MSIQGLYITFTILFLNFKVLYLLRKSTIQIQMASQKLDVTRYVPLNYLSTLHLYYLILRNMANQTFLDPNKNNNITQFYFF